MRDVRAVMGACFVCAAAFIVLVGVFTALTLLHGAVPFDLTESNMVASLEILEDEGTYPSFGKAVGLEEFKGFAGQGNQIDNYTNKWMIQSADSTHYFDVSEYNKENKSYDPDRRKPIDGEMSAQVFSSGWKDGVFWSGYRVFLKPLLLVTDVWGIRLLQSVLLIISMAWAAIALARNVGFSEAGFMVLSVLAINPLNVFLSLDQASDFIQALFSVVTVLWMLRRGVRRRWLVTYFMALGAIVAFINCFITPLLTLGFPLAACLLWQRRQGFSTKGQLVSAVQSGIAWCFGYAGSLFSVWVISATFKGTSRMEAIVKGISRFVARSGGDDASIPENVFNAVQNNINLNVPFLWLLAVAAVVLIVLRCRARRDKQPLFDNAGLLILALAPFAWIVVFNNHSMIHSWMVHDIFSISIWCLLCCIYYLASAKSGAKDGRRQLEGV